MFTYVVGKYLIVDLIFFLEGGGNPSMDWGMGKARTRIFFLHASLWFFGINSNESAREESTLASLILWHDPRYEVLQHA